MKKFVLLVLTFALFIACKTETVRYTQNSPEIDTYKKAHNDYESGNWDSLKSHYADTAKLYFNATDKNPKTVDESIEQDKKDLLAFSSYGIVDESTEYEMVVTDDGETWVNFWGVWKGTLAANNQTLEIPVHLTAQFVNGKIVKEHGYWDNAPIVAALQEIEAAKMAEEGEETEN